MSKHGMMYELRRVNNNLQHQRLVVTNSCDKTRGNEQQTPFELRSLAPKFPSQLALNPKTLLLQPKPCSNTCACASNQRECVWFERFQVCVNGVH